jgi:hypothetical protein
MQNQRNHFFGLATLFDLPFNYDIDGHITLLFDLIHLKWVVQGKSKITEFSK